MMHTTKIRLLLTAAIFMMSACSETDQSKPAALNAGDKAAADTTVASSPGKPSAPIFFRYEVLGTPMIGQPVSVNVSVSSSVTNAPINLFFRAADESSMLFADSQSLRRVFSIAPGDGPGSSKPGDGPSSSTQQITLIPQRQGRLYLNVSAEIETGNDTLMRAMSIPIQVGSAPPELAVNGELIETADGETVISMPAKQN